MQSTSTSEKNHFLNNIQKKVKQEIMEKIMDGIFQTLQIHKEKFTDHQSILDILFSILVMTNREVLTRIIYSSDSQIHTKRILKDFFKTVDEQVRHSLSENYQKKISQNNSH